MRKTAVLSAIAAAMTFSMPAYSAECQAELADLNERISKNDNNLRVAASGPLSTEIRRLRDAARILDRNGRQDACMSVVDAMEAMLTNPNRVDSGNRRSLDHDSWLKSESDRIKAARPVAELKQPVRATTMIGADVRNTRNADLGEVEDFVLDPANGKVQMIIMSYGGFLGIGDDQVAVPWQELSVAGEEDDRVFILNISEDAIENAPRFKRNEWSTVNTDSWRQKNQQFYKQNRR